MTLQNGSRKGTRNLEPVNVISLVYFQNKSTDPDTKIINNANLQKANGFNLERAH